MLKISAIFHSPFRIVWEFSLCMLLVGNALAFSTPPKEDGLQREARKEPAHTFVFDCDPDLRVVVQVLDARAWLFLPSETVSLDLAASHQQRYVGDGYQLTIKGDRALLQTKDGALRNCVNNRRLAIWEHAKLQGVDYRAVGNEPGWVVEISGDRIEFIGDYGQWRLMFTLVSTVVDADNKQSVMKAVNDEHKLTLKILGLSCADTMSGEQFSTTVQLSVDDRQFTGCGTALH